MLLRVDYKSGQPVYAQLVAQIKTGAGALRPGEALPAIGPLAEELRVGLIGYHRRTMLKWPG